TDNRKILEELKSMRTSLEGKIDFLATEIESTKNISTEVQKRLENVEERMSGAEFDVSQLLLKNEEQAKENNRLWDKIIDFEARSRRDIRIFGIPEGDEKDAPDMESFVKDLLTQLVPWLQGEALAVERAHCTLQGRPRPGQRPWAIVAKLQNFKSKEEILRQARDIRNFEWKAGHRLQIYQDLPKELLDKHKKFDRVQWICRDQSLQTGFRYPALLLI
uniref:L1 transposable element RRM domain-containing protein n=1 Tax=Latimeria chalumnae TaxID=7897 RepID=H2ZW14_LATCH